MTILEQMLEGTKSVAILGHIRPDGDCPVSYTHLTLPTT